jgi:hypothetical protein
MRILRASTLAVVPLAAIALAAMATAEATTRRMPSLASYFAARGWGQPAACA